ncbi:hypothetical protein K439DRAFT_194459 [Ramaria rubella]|nr:hypothetical protein K439DRAFT_194459 [Ramaria rubella]
MASITGCCPVCIEPFNAEEHRPHCIPCGHLFCLPCLTRLPACPVCRTPFHPADIRWLFPTYERPHDNASSTTDCPTVLDWLHESRNDLERRLIALAREEPEDAHAVGKLHAEIKTWLAAYHAAQLPQSPETHALSLAAASLDIAARPHCVEPLELTTLRPCRSKNATSRSAR